MDIFLPSHERFLITGPLFAREEEQVQIPKWRASFLTRWYGESRNKAIIKLSWINLQASQEAKYVLSTNLTVRGNIKATEN